MEVGVERRVREVWGGFHPPGNSKVWGDASAEGANHVKGVFFFQSSTNILQSWNSTEILLNVGSREHNLTWLRARLPSMENRRACSDRISVAAGAREDFVFQHRLVSWRKSCRKAGERQEGREMKGQRLEQPWTEQLCCWSAALQDVWFFVVPTSAANTGLPWSARPGTGNDGDSAGWPDINSKAVNARGRGRAADWVEAGYWSVVYAKCFELTSHS